MKMPKEKLETKARKAVIRIDTKINDISNMLRDLNMKLCYVIKHKKEYGMDMGYKEKHNDRYNFGYE
jgi:hypothetical protein